MTTLVELIEGDGGDEIQATFYEIDADGEEVLVVPTSVHYRVDCMTNAQQIKGFTSLTPGSTVTITLEQADTQIIDDDNEEEMRQVMVVANKDTDQQKTQIFRFHVRNVAALT